MHHRPRHRAHIAAHTRPMTLAQLPISRSAPPRGHTPRNLTLFAHQPPTAAASGAEAVPVGSGCASSHPPALPCAGRGRGVTNPLRRGTAAAGRGLLPSYRRLLLGRPLPHRPSDALGIQGGVDCLPYPPLTHRRRRGWWTEDPKTQLPTPGRKPGSKQETQQPTPGRKPGSRQETPHPRTEGSAGTGDAGSGETRGVRGVGWVVGAGARRAGRPGSRRGRKAPGRLPGRLLLWASAPPRLTSCRQCGKMLHEGSHRRRSLRRPSSMVRQKPGRFRNDRALLYLRHHPRDRRRIKCA